MSSATGLGALTHVKTAHEAKLAVNYQKLLVVGPEKNDIACSSVKGFNSLARCLGQAKVRDTLEGLAELCLQIAAVRYVVGMPKDANIRMQSFKSMSGVLHAR